MTPSVPSSRAAVALLALGIFALYAPSIRLEFIYDDHEVIGAQAAPRSLADVARIFGERHFYNLPYYRPVTRATLLLQKALHGDRPGPFHFFNAALAGAAAAAAFALLRAPAFGMSPGAAVLGAALFMAHPAASSCVYPAASGRETLMPALWMTLAAAAWLRGGTRGRAAAISAMLLALLSKEQAVVLPGILLAADLLRLSPDSPPLRRDAARSWIARHAPSAFLLAGYFAVRRALFGGTEMIPGDPLGPAKTALYAVQTAFAPPFGLVYEPPPSAYLVPIRLLPALAAFGALGALAAKRRFSLRTAAFWAIWFLFAMLPSANLLRQEAMYDERYVFLSILALAAPAAALASGSGRRGMAAGWIAVGLLAAISIRRSADFANDAVFHDRWLASNPSSINANVQMGRVHYDRGETAKAIGRYQKALEMAPDFPEALIGLQAALAAAGRKEEAFAILSRALELRPDDSDANYNMGVFLTERGDNAGARRRFEAALAVKPNNASAHFNLGVLARGEGRIEEAISRYRESIRWNPDFAPARYNLGNAMVEKGDLEAAAGCYREAVRIDPKFLAAHLNLGVAMAKLGRRDEAARAFGRALEIEPGNPQAVQYLTQTLREAAAPPAGSGPAAANAEPGPGG